MQYFIYIAVLGALVGTSVQRAIETTPLCTECTEGARSPSHPPPVQEPLSNILPVIEPPSSALPEPACRCQLGSIRRKRQCSEYSESLDHSAAQGWGAGQPDWSCLPHVVEQNHRVCYRTTIYTCDDEENPGIRCALKRRKSAFDESDKILERTTGQTLLLLRSPRYGVKDYRNREFCIYNVNMSQCTSGLLRIRTVQDHMDLYNENGDCSDYLQFDFPRSLGHRRFCGTESVDFRVRDTNFYVVFWSDSQFHSSGFELSVTCVGDSLDSGSDP